MGKICISSILVNGNSTLLVPWRPNPSESSLISFSYIHIQFVSRSQWFGIQNTTRASHQSSTITFNHSTLSLHLDERLLTGFPVSPWCTLPPGQAQSLFNTAAKVEAASCHSNLSRVPFAFCVEGSFHDRSRRSYTTPILPFSILPFLLTLSTPRTLASSSSASHLLSPLWLQVLALTIPSGWSLLPLHIVCLAPPFLQVFDPKPPLSLTWPRLHLTLLFSFLVLFLHTPPIM